MHFAFCLSARLVYFLADPDLLPLSLCLFAAPHSAWTPHAAHSRVEVLENDNARLYKELEAYRSGDSAAPTSPLSPTTANPAALQAELVGLRRQLAARDQELAKLHGRMQGLNSEANAAREMVARKDMELQEALMRSKQEEVVVDSDDSDSEEGDEMMLGGGGKKDLKSAGSMAFMVCSSRPPC